MSESYAQYAATAGRLVGPMLIVSDCVHVCCRSLLHVPLCNVVRVEQHMASLAQLSKVC
jgi:hypothetical protein